MKNLYKSLFIVVPIGLLLTSCNKSEAQVLEDHYHAMVESSGTDTEKCAESSRVADAWARQGDQEKYDHWKMISDLYCLSARAGG